MRLKEKNYKKYLDELPKISQKLSDIKILFSSKNFREILLKKIHSAKNRICIIALYLENDEAGKNILSSLYSAKNISPNLDINIFVDLHRAKRNRIGENNKNFTNAEWYYEMAKENLGISIPIYGVPINATEALGVLHLKGFIIDDTILYSGANINNVYLNQYDKYRYDRYHLIKNKKLTDTMFSWIQDNIKKNKAVYRLNSYKKYKRCKRYKIRQFRQKLKKQPYQFIGDANNKELSVIPLIGLGKNNILNEVIINLFSSTEKKLTLCTPYFNLPSILLKNIISLLQKKIKIEIILADKTANDFYIPKYKPFKIIGILPYLYEINLKNFFRKLKYYIDSNQLLIRIWKKNNNTFHSKGIWIDKKWILITGNNFTQRSWRLDLENAILIHDPLFMLKNTYKKELELMRNSSYLIKEKEDLENIKNYPKCVKKIIMRLCGTYINKLLNKIL